MVIQQDTQIAQSTEIANTPESAVSFLDSQPPPSVSWAVAFVVVATLVLRIITWINTAKSRSDDIFRRREDEYWFRSVVLGTCLDRISTFSIDLNELIAISIDALQKTTSPTDRTIIYAGLMVEYRALQNTAIFGLAELAIFDEEYYDNCVLILEGVENKLVTAMGVEVLSGDNRLEGLRAIKAEATRIEILKYLKQVHSKLF